MSELRIVQVSDLHLSPSEIHHVENWEIVLEWIGAHRPDLVAVTGDVIFEDPDSIEDLDFARSQLQRIPVAWKILPGNHDIGDCLFNAAAGQRVTEARRQRWLDMFGPDRWFASTEHWALFGLNAQILYAAPFGEAQWEWLENTVADLPHERPIAVFSHKGLFLDHPSETMATTDVLHPEVRHRLCRLFGDRRVRLLASGHKHQYRCFGLDGTTHVWAPSVACVNKAPDVKSWGLRVVGFVEYRLLSSGSVRHRLVGDDFLVRNEAYMRTGSNA